MYDPYLKSYKIYGWALAIVSIFIYGCVLHFFQYQVFHDFESDGTAGTLSHFTTFFLAVLMWWLREQMYYYRDKSQTLLGSDKAEISESDKFLEWLTELKKGRSND